MPKEGSLSMPHRESGQGWISNVLAMTCSTQDFNRNYMPFFEQAQQVKNQCLLEGFLSDPPWPTFEIEFRSTCVEAKVIE